MHKLGSSKNKKTKQSSKKKINSRLMDRIEEELGYDQQKVSAQLQQKRRRLRKQADIDGEDNSHMIQPEVNEEDEEYEPVDEEADVKDYQYKNYQYKDDQQLQEDEKRKQEAKQTKKATKNNTKITQFTDKNQERTHEGKPAKNKQKKDNTQMLLMESFKKVKRHRRDNEEHFIVPDNQALSDDEDSDIFRARVIAAKKVQDDNRQNLASKVNGDLTEKQCIDIAMRLSLQEKSGTNATNNLDSYTYEMKQTAKGKSGTNATNNLDSYAYEMKQTAKENTNNILFKKSEEESKKDQDKKKQTKMQKNKRSKSSSVERSVGKKSAEKGRKSAEKVNKSKKAGKKEEIKKEGPLSGHFIAMTGQFEPYNKDQLTELIKQLGGSVPSTFAKKTTELFQGLYCIDQFKRKTGQDVTTTNKSKEAVEKGLPIINNDDLQNFFLNKTGKSLTQHIEGERSGDTQKIDDGIAMDMEKPIPYIVQGEGGTTNWTEKYKPKSIGDIVGQSTQIKDLTEWLKTWGEVHIQGNKGAIKISKKNAESKAVLISGDPGLGKTSTARLIAAEMNYDIVEFNASDVRNKSSVMQIQSSGFGLGIAKNLQRTLTLMDEVDGMSSGDRGGVAAIIQMIKNTKSPVICICNDRQSQKIRSLANHCLDIRFHKPDRRQIVKRLQYILRRENAIATDSSLEKIVEIFQNDVRKILSYLQVFVRTKSRNINIQQINTDKAQGKDSTVMTGPFQAAKQLMNRSSMRIYDRMDCYYSDSQLVPLLIHENYLDSSGKGKQTRKDFHRIVQANQGFVLADVIDRKIRKQQNYALMPAFGFMMTVYPTEKASQGMAWPTFPSFLGKFSMQRKTQRLIRQVKSAIAPFTTLTNKSAKFPYSMMLFKSIQEGLRQEQIEEVVDFMELYNLSPNLLNQNLLSIQYNPGKDNLLGDIGASTKTKLTRTYNKRHQATKLKGLKVKKSTQDHTKYDPQLQCMQDESVGDLQEESEDLAMVQDKKKSKKK